MEDLGDFMGGLFVRGNHLGIWSIIYVCQHPIFFYLLPQVFGNIFIKIIEYHFKLIFALFFLLIFLLKKS
jgi:hypothetical protein